MSITCPSSGGADGAGAPAAPSPSSGVAGVVLGP
jgi:hypothetical protein